MTAKGSTQRIGRIDWIKAGLAVLGQEGIGEVRVEPLAARLGVTKGSFYWHFADRAALHAAMLEQWQLAATRDIIRQVEDKASDAHTRLVRLLDVTTASPAGARLEIAIRAWAVQDATVAAAVATADRERIGYVVGLLMELGLPPSIAELRARTIYLALIGSYFTGETGAALAGDGLRTWLLLR